MKIFQIDDTECVIMGRGHELQPVHDWLWADESIYEENKRPVSAVKMIPKRFYAIHIGVGQDTDLDEPSVYVELCADHTQILLSFYDAVESHIAVVEATPDEVINGGKAFDILNSNWSLICKPGTPLC